MTALLRALTAQITPGSTGSTGSSSLNTAAGAHRNPAIGPLRRSRPARERLEVMQPCGLSWPSLAECVACSGLVPQLFSVRVWRQPWLAIPASAVSQCDGGRGSEAGSARLLLPHVAQHLFLFGALPQGIPESFSLSWPESGRTNPVRAVQFWPLGENSWTAMKRWRAREGRSAGATN